MRRTGISLIIACAVVAAVWCAGCGQGAGRSAATGKDVAATVNGQVITMKDIDAKIAKLPAYYQQMLKDRKKELLDDMVLEALLYNEAKIKGVQNNKEVQETLEETQKKIMISKYIKDDIDVKTTVSDKEVEAYFNTHKQEFVMPERMRASHILVKTEDEAKAVQAELAAGKSFEDAAKEKSTDTSAKKGGDLGYFTKGQMVPEFEEAAAKLEINQVSGIVKTQFGYHIIKLTDKKPSESQDLKAVSARIKSSLESQKKQSAFNDVVARVKAKAAIKINDSLFPAAAPANAVKPAQVKKGPAPVAVAPAVPATQK